MRRNRGDGQVQDENAAEDADYGSMTVPQFKMQNAKCKHYPYETTG